MVVLDRVVLGIHLRTSLVQNLNALFINLLVLKSFFEFLHIFAYIL